jgi:hypothetical protein
LGALVGLLELPIAMRYFQIQSMIGNIGVGLDDFRDNSAGLLSFLSHSNHQSLLQRLLPFYPHVHLGIEASGFLGITWVVLLLVAFRQRKLRTWIACAALAYLLSLGPDFVVMHAFRLFPGMESLRAIGRAQLFVILASLPAVFLFLESQKGWARYAPLTLILLELLPGDLPHRISIDTTFFSGPSPFSRKINSLPDRDPLLVMPLVGSGFQLYALQLENPLYGGYSGRIPVNAYLLHTILTGQQPLREKVHTGIRFSRAHWLVSLDSATSSTLEKNPELSFLGCYSHFEFNPCLFQAVDKQIPVEPLHVDKDATWEYPPQRRGHLAILRAEKSGVLDYDSLGTCKVVVHLKFPFIPEISMQNTMTGMAIRGVEYKKGDVICEEKSPQAIFSLPLRWRPTKRYEIVCR